MSRIDKTECVADRGYVLKLGKYRNYTIEEVLKFDPQYLVWLADNTNFDLDHKLYDEAEDRAANEQP